MLDRSSVLPHLIARHVADVPDRVAMLDVEGRQSTYRELQDTYRTWSDALRRLGVAPGDTVATMLPNSFVAYEAWLGAAWLGAVEVPINNAYLGDMLRHLLDDSQARVLVISRRFVDRLAGVAADLGHLRTVVVPDAEPGDALPDLPFDVLDGDPFFAGATPADDLEGPAAYDIAALIYTSGTTGPSKGVLVPVGRAVRVRPPAARRHARRRRRLLHRVPGLPRVGEVVALHVGALPRPHRHPRGVQPHGVLGGHPALRHPRRRPGRADGRPPHARPAVAHRRRHAARERVHGPAHPAGGGVQGPLRRAGRHGLRHVRGGRAARLGRLRPRQRHELRPRPPRPAPLRGAHRRRARRGGARRRGRRADRPVGRPVGHHAGLLQPARAHGRGVAQRVVPHRRRVPVRRGRQLLLRRSPEGRHPPPGREHLVVRGGGGGEPAPRRAGVRGRRRALRARRGRDQGPRGGRRRRRGRPRRAHRLPGAPHAQVHGAPLRGGGRRAAEDRRHLPHPQGRAAGGRPQRGHLGSRGRCPMEAER